MPEGPRRPAKASEKWGGSVHESPARGEAPRAPMGTYARPAVEIILGTLKAAVGGILAKTRKYELPEFLRGVVSQADYERWLHRKARAHVKRDRKRGNKSATGAEYRAAIHKAVTTCGGRDVYTGEPLAWHLISKYTNDESKNGRRKYKAGFAQLPTVDHVADGLGPADFAICGWRTNDAKGDLSLAEFIELCTTIVRFHNLSSESTARAELVS